MKKQSTILTLLLFGVSLLPVTIIAAPENPSININSGAISTTSTSTSLQLDASFASEVKLSNDGNFEPIPITPDWNIDGSGNDTDIYINFDSNNDAQDGTSSTFSPSTDFGTSSLGGAYNQGAGISPKTINWMKDPSCEIDTAHLTNNWIITTMSNDHSLSCDNTYSRYGNKSMKIISTSSNIQVTTDILSHDFGSYVLSFYAYDPNAILTNSDVKMVIQGSAIEATHIEEESNGWQRFIFTGIIGDNSETGYGIEVALGKTIYVDSFQFEGGTNNYYNYKNLALNKTFALPYIDGSLGTGASWILTSPEDLSATLQSGGNLQPTTQYTYWATATLNGDQALSSILSATTTTTSSDKSIQLSWSAIPGATGYTLYRCNRVQCENTISSQPLNNGSNYSRGKQKIELGNVTSYLDTNDINDWGLEIPNGMIGSVQTGGNLLETTHTYQISAYNGSSWSALGNRTYVLPTSTNKTVLVSWNSVPGATEYSIVRSRWAYESNPAITTKYRTTNTTFTDDGNVIEDNAPPTTIEYYLQSFPNASDENFEHNAPSYIDKTFLEYALANIDNDAGTIDFWAKNNADGNAVGEIYNESWRNRIKWIGSQICVDGNNINDALMFNECAPFTWNKGEWKHFTKSWDANLGTTKLYIDGVLIIDISINSWTPLQATKFRFGSTSWSDVSNALVYDEFHRSNRVLSAADIATRIIPTWQPITTPNNSFLWELTSGDGFKKVFALFRDEFGNEATIVSDAIVLDVDGEDNECDIISVQNYGGSGDSSQGCQAITAGSLSISAPSSIAFPSQDITASAVVNSASFASPVIVEDMRDSSAGFSLTIDATDFDTGSHVIDYENLSFKTNTESSPSSSSLSGVSAPNTVLLPFPTDNASRSGQISVLLGTSVYRAPGQWQVTPDLELTIPAFTSSGSYSSVLTFTLT